MINEVLPLISVIVPVYNVEKYLNDCIDSLVNQTYRNIEIILVDDGSPDNCPTICDEWSRKDERIKVVHKENGGLSDARNAGMAVAHGDYIGFVDSDDMVDKLFYEYLFNAIKETNSEISACGVNFFIDGETVNYDDKAYTVKKNTSSEAMEELIHGRGYRATAWNKLYSKEIIKGECFEKGKLHEDEFFTYRMIDKCSRLAFVDCDLYCYRQRPGSIMSTFSIRHLDFLEAYSKRLELLKEKYPSLYKQDKTAFCIACLNQYLLGNQAGKNKKIIHRKLKEFRRKVSFDCKDFLKEPLKNKVYIIGSTCCFIGLFSMLRNRKGLCRYENTEKDK